MNYGGKGDTMRPTDHKKWSNNYDKIKWTKEEDEEFTRLQDRLSTERPMADRNEKTIP
jgi:hypothetical protein